MSQIEIEPEVEQQPTEPRGVKRTLAWVIALMLLMLVLIMLYTHLPRAAQTTNNGTIDVATPTPSMINPQDSVTVNRMVIVDGVRMTVMQVQEARSFSDLRKQRSAYTIRVYLQTQNTGREPVGVDFTKRAQLLLPGDRSLAPQLISVAPIFIPNETHTGYLDFGVEQPVSSLSSLSLRIDQATIPFK